MKKKKKKNKFKKLIGWLHLWLGLLSGSIVFIMAITGCIYVFHDEIKDVVYDYRLVEPETKPYIKPTLLIAKSNEAFPQMSTDLIAYAGKNRPAFIYGLEEGKGHYAYFNPYSGEVLTRRNLEDGFFETILNLHMYLLLPQEIGKQVVGVSTLIFVFMLISGFIIWWPKKKKNLKQRLKIKWNAKWRRVNYDWHSVTGFYVGILAFVIAITGLNFSYDWVHEGIYKVGNLGREYQDEETVPLIDTTLQSHHQAAALDLALSKTFIATPENKMFFVWDQGANLPIITGSYPKTLHYHNQTNFFFHPKTGDLLAESYYEDKSPGLKLQEMSYGLHTGQYFGIPGKIIIFILSLIIAALPVTGFVIWWGRRNKKK